MRDVMYFAPDTLNSALKYYHDHLDVTLFAGGTDLLVGMEYETREPKAILDLKALSSELSYIREQDGKLKIGSMTTISQLVRSDYLKDKYPFLVDAASVLGSWQIRTTATVGGNLCNGAPSAELTPCFLILNADVVVASVEGEQTIPMEQFLLGPGKVDLKPGQILKEIVIHEQDAQLKGGYACRKLRRSMDVAIVNMAAAIVNMAAAVKLNPQGIVEDARIALGAVAPVAFRVAQAEAALTGKPFNQDSIENAVDLCVKAAKPIDDIRSTAEYRREMVGVYMRQLLTELQQGGK